MCTSDKNISSSTPHTKQLYTMVDEAFKSAPSPLEHILAAPLLCIPTTLQIHSLYMENMRSAPVGSNEDPLVFTVFHFSSVTSTYECWTAEELGGRTSPSCSQLKRGQSVEGTWVSQSFLAVMLGGQKLAGVPGIPNSPFHAYVHRYR